jgi:phosphoglycerate dehydrogenase-like enzyme
MRVVCCTRTPQPDELADWMRGMDRLTDLLTGSDFVLVTLPLTDQTRGMLDRAAFAAMRPTGVVINVARGAIIDEEALYTALEEHRIGGAIIDVWYRYPPHGQPQGTRPSSFAFHELDNVMMTPHASGWTDALLPRRNRAVATNLNRLARGESLLNVVRAPVT